KRLSPFTVPSFLANLAAGHISIRYGFKGPIGTPVTACAASVQAIGDAARLIRSGEADVAICGGSEACIDLVSLGGFASARALSTPVGDVSELEAIKSVFGRDGKIAVSATKSATGHLLGAAGGAEAIFTILALRDQVAPPTLNLENGDAAADGVDLVSREARRMTIEHAISN